MKLVIELTDGERSACGDSEMVSYMLAGESRIDLEREYEHKMPTFYFEE
jgi:hypothetical protein